MSVHTPSVPGLDSEPMIDVAPVPVDRVGTRLGAAVAVLTAYTDVATLPAASQDLLAEAVARRVIVGRGGVFAPASSLTRGELARSLALVAGLPQRIPAQPSFTDVATSDPFYPFVETVAGADHFYTTGRDELLRCVEDWLGKVLGSAG